MGEYARRTRDGAEVKIGTCENMYYLRADQRNQVTPLLGSLNPNDPETARQLRFRFPWPDEDGTAPGEFENYERAVAVPDATAPQEVKHYLVQFVARTGYLLSLPCPEGPSTHEFKIVRNGFAGAVQLTQQKLLADGRLVPVCRCGGCGALWRVEEPAEIEALAVALWSEGDRRERLGTPHGTGPADRWFWDQVADRLLKGAKLHLETAS